MLDGETGKYFLKKQQKNLGQLGSTRKPWNYGHKIRITL